ncbi:MAG: methylmalonyl Co-A mutase-associated GTPase MeaB [bacterium]
MTQTLGNNNNTTWSDRILAGDRRALARVISLLENQLSDGFQALKELYSQTGQAHIIGLTGPPGAGKSSLVDGMIKEIRARGHKVAVIAVDPTSPFTGGAILGDRIRMQRWASDPGVYIRSMGTRGSLGGLARAVYASVQLLDAAGFPYILVETVGVGQSEVDIVQVADTVVVVSVPGLGDDIQTSKAGIMEIGDVFTVNKADLPGSQRVVIELQNMLDLGSHGDWRPPVITTVATTGQGISELVTALENHLVSLKKNNLLIEKRTARQKEAVLQRLTERIRRDVTELWSSQHGNQVWDDLASKKVDPYTLEEQLYFNWKGGKHIDNQH